jgi:hypothetical protein
MVEDRGRLLLIDRDAARYHTRDIVRALHQTITAVGAGAISGELLKRDVEGALTANAHPPPGEARHEHISRDIKEQGDGHPAAALGQLDIECARLAQRAGEAIQQDAARSIRPSESLHHHLHDQLVRHQLALVHVRARRPSKRRAATPMLTQQIARGNMGDTE